MLDIKFIKENKALVEKAIKDKKGGEVDLDRLLSLYEDRTRMRGELDDLNAERNKAAQDRDIEAGKNLKERAQTLEDKFKNVEKAFVELMLQIPNVPSPDTPIGDEGQNKVVREWGEKPDFSFKPKAHWDLGKALDIIDNETAAEVSGARFTYLKGDAALLQFALLHHALADLTDTEKLKTIKDKTGIGDIKLSPFVPVIPPTFMKSAVMNRMARLHPIDDRFYFEKDDLVLVGSAEHTLGPMHMDHIFEEDELPIRYAGYGTAFRREAGTYGKDTKGILRVHQFDKLEIESFSLPEDSYKEQDFIVAIQEHFMQELEIPYRVLLIATGEMSKPDHRQYDIEAWMPGQDSYRETHTSDLIGGYQPRRLNTRVKRKDGKVEHVHMNDATVFAIGRTLIAIMENYQQEDGSIKIPKVLQKYMGKDRIKKR